MGLVDSPLMQSKAKTVKEYLAELPADRRAALEAVRAVILKNLDKDIEEGMSYGMIGYSVPHRVFPPGYHCDPSMPLPYAGLASQKGHLSLYLMSGCMGTGDAAHARWFQQAWAKSGKKLDMGKACIRFKTLDDLPLDVIGEAVRRVNAKTYVSQYQAALEAMEAAKARRSPKPVKKGAAPKESPKRARPTSNAKKPGSRTGTR